MIFITQEDVLRRGKTIYTIHKYIDGDIEALERLNVPRFKKFSLNAASNLRSVFLTFKHVKYGSDMFFRTCKDVE